MKYLGDIHKTCLENVPEELTASSIGVPTAQRAPKSSGSQAKPT